MTTMLSTAARASTHMSTQENCTRCHGHMVQEMCTDFESDCGHSTFGGLRCIQCGDIVDEVILRNRCIFNPKTVLAVRSERDRYRTDPRCTAHHAAALVCLSFPFRKEFAS